MKHKVLSVKQPFAYLLAAGIKDIENRSWKLPEKYKGERVLIHASGLYAIPNSVLPSSIFTTNQWGIIDELNQRQIIRGRFDRSSIIGSVEIVDCLINHPSIWAEKTPYLINPSEHPLKPIYNWVVAEPILFDKPILNVKGKLGFWDYDLTGEYEKLLK